LNSENGLAQLLGEVSGFADEIVVGVDASSTDRTREVASRWADVLFRFEHPTGTVSPARMLPLEYASGDWVLSVDDDELMDAAFPSLLPELLRSTRYTHYWFPRKWIVHQHPLEYVHARPWFPDWQLRLFKNDKSLVWHSPKVHYRYRVIGTGCWETRTSILHFERLKVNAAQRAEKVRRYRAAGSDQLTEPFYGPLDSRNFRILNEPSPSEVIRNLRHGKLVPGVIRVASESSLPPWKASLRVKMPLEISAGEQLSVDVTAMNIGTLAWHPPTQNWPNLKISYHTLDEAGKMITWNGDRTPIGRIIEPGESANFLVSFKAPQKSGNYFVEWDMVSEDECWFAECGSRTMKLPIRVTSLTAKKSLTQLFGTWKVWGKL